MFPFHLPSLPAIDRTSFLLGVLAGVLLWGVFRLLRPVAKAWWRSLQAISENMNIRNQVMAEETLRREMIEKAQRRHLSAPLFALDEILVPPRLIAPPPFHEAGSPPQSYAIAASALPYLPDWPELTSTLGAPTLTPLEALAHGNHIAIIGQPGSGKSVALAHLATQLAQQTSTNADEMPLLPLYLHITDFLPYQAQKGDAASALIKAVTAQTNSLAQPQINTLLKSVFKVQKRKIILLLDGMDELLPAQVNEVSRWLFDLNQRYPALQMVVTASPDALGDLPHIGFYPLALACWTQLESSAFVEQWGKAWNEHILSKAENTPYFTPIEPLLISRWLLTERNIASPLHFTLKVWSAFAGDTPAGGTSSEDLPALLAAHILRFLPDKKYMPALQQLAAQFVLGSKSSLSVDEVEKRLSAYQIIEESAAMPAGAMDLPGAATSAPAKNKRGNELITSQGERIIDALQHSAIFIQRSGRQISFSSPVFVGYLASLKLTPEEAQGLVERATWSSAQQTFRFLSVYNAQAAWMAPLIQETAAPMYLNWLRAARWLPNSPVNSILRSHILGNFVRLMQNDHLPFATRCRFAAVFVTLGDAASLKLFRSLVNSASPQVRQLGVLGLGALGNPQALPDLLPHLMDSAPEVRSLTCLAISGLTGEMARNSLVEILLQGDETLRQAAAEVLALRGAEGRQILEDASVVEDLLTRHAAVHGVMQLRDEWSTGLLEKIAIQDGQWIVRNAAAQALDERKLPLAADLIPLQLPAENGWALSAAGKMGLSIQPGEWATDIFIQVLKSGAQEDQRAALRYLRKEASEGVVGIFYHKIYDDQLSLHDDVVSALWWIAATGYTMPPTTKYGVG